jgi:hypothetical protein
MVDQILADAHSARLPGFPPQQCAREPYRMNAALMSLELHERGIHVE